MKTIVVFFTLFAVACALKVTDVTGPTPPPVYCPDTLCAGLPDGNHPYVYHHQKRENYFVQCVDGKAYCQACWPLTLKFKTECNQCLYSMADDCHTTKSWVPEKRYPCPDNCPSKGPNFNGNIGDYHQPKHYIACWKGRTVGCINCPAGLEFNEQWNACLYDGKYFTEPLHH